MLDRSKNEEQKKAIHSGYDMKICFNDLAIYGPDAQRLPDKQLDMLIVQDQVWNHVATNRAAKRNTCNYTRTIKTTCRVTGRNCHLSRLR